MLYAIAFYVLDVGHSGLTVIYFVPHIVRAHLWAGGLPDFYELVFGSAPNFPFLYSVHVFALYVVVVCYVTL
jgi:hypothetical protein